MTMTKLFTMTFDEEMKSRGYKRKGRLYYKLSGEILQGVVLKPTNPYEIRFTAIPYWMTGKPSWVQNALKSHTWAEYGHEISPGVSSYYIESREAFNRDYMSACFELAKKYFLPAFDKITDTEAYINSFLPPFEDPKTKEKVQYLFCPTLEIGERYAHLNDNIFICSRGDYCNLQYYFLYEAYLQRDFDAPYKRLTEVLQKILPDLFEDKRIFEYQLGNYVKCMENGDFDWIKMLHQQMREIMIPFLRDELKLNTFHL